MTAREVLRESAARIRSSKAVLFPETARSDAKTLLAFVVGRQPALDDRIDAAARRRFERLVDRRVRGEPVSYVTGRAMFLGLELAVTPGVFVPKVTVELLARKAIQTLRPKRRPVLLDVGTGIGSVALAVAAALPRAEVTGVDVSPSAIALARRNAAGLGIRNARFHSGDLFDPVPAELERTVEVITSNPPLLSRADVRWFQRTAAVFEPVETLSDLSRTGLTIVERIATGSRDWLVRGGKLMLQVSSPVSRQIAAILRRAGYSDVVIAAGAPMRRHNRLVIARR